MRSESSGDIVGEAHWSREWNSEFDARPEDERIDDWRNYVTVRFDALFARHMPKPAGRQPVVLEVGCARSRWLPYFGRRFGAVLKGLDYSELGCRQAERILRNAGQEGEIAQGDLFGPPRALLGVADVVFSWGLVEHFTNTGQVCAALQALARPGGTVITIIPNMRGMVGTVQRWVNEDLFNLHIPLNDAQLRAAVVASGGEVVFCEYFVPCNFWVVNPGTERPRGFAGRLKTAAHGFGKLITAGVWQLEHRLHLRMPATPALSPYVVCISRRPT